MAKTYVSDGDEITVTLAAAGKSGDLVVLGNSNTAAVLFEDGAVGDTVSAKNNGVFTLASDGTAAAQYDDAYWDATTSQVTNTSNAGANPGIGKFHKAVAANATTCQVLLNGTPD